MTHPQRKPIGQLVDEATRIESGGYELEHWRDGSWGMFFVRAPNGEGTQVSPEALTAALQRLFEEHF